MATANKNRKKITTCGKKVRYTTLLAANLAARALQRINVEPITSYECPFCNCWHIGHAWSYRTLMRVLKTGR